MSLHNTERKHIICMFGITSLWSEFKRSTWKMLNGSCVPCQEKGKGVVCQGWLVIGGDFFPPPFKCTVYRWLQLLCSSHLVFYLLSSELVGWLASVLSLNIVVASKLYTYFFIKVTELLIKGISRSVKDIPCNISALKCLVYMFSLVVYLHNTLHKKCNP